MDEIKLYGASDDLIEVESTSFGNEEFNVNYDYAEDSGLVAVSDGSIFRVRYDEDGIWRFTPLVIGSAFVSIDFGQDDDRHSDVVTMAGDNLTWVVYGLAVAK